MEHWKWHEQHPDEFCLYCGGNPLDISEALAEQKQKATNLQNHQEVRESLYYAMKRVLKEVGICCQCSSNALSNFVGGYREVGIDCIRYCRNGHKTTIN